MLNYIEGEFFTVSFELNGSTIVLSAVDFTLFSLLDAAFSDKFCRVHSGVFNSETEFEAFDQDVKTVPSKITFHIG
jgi:hypothetical protein